MNNKSEISRRHFIKSTLGAGVAVSFSGLLPACSDYKPAGLPTAVLGKTGVKVPRIAMGLGSRFCTIDKEEEALELLSYALDNGFYYWDTAHIYSNLENGANSEERIGKILKDRRNEVFLSTKVTARDPEEAMRQIELSMNRLQTDHLDELKIHSVESMEDVDKMSGKGQLIEIVHRMKEEGLTRFIGYSGHGDAVAMKTMAERGDFDTMLIALNHWNMDINPQKRQELVIPSVLEKGMAVLIMKAVRPRENISHLKPADLVRFALSIEEPTALVLGMESKEVVNSNLDLLRNFKAMDETEKQSFARALNPYFRHENLDWMKKDYADGNWSLA